jgi:N-acetylneuraminate lyase
MLKLAGILPALITPFDAKGKFNLQAFEQLLARLYAADVDGVYLCGSTGEGMLQSAAQRKAITAAAVKKSPPGKSVIVHVGANTTSEAIELARHAAQAGAHAVSALPPLVGGYSFAEIKAYYQAIAAASELPLLLYYFPEVAPAVKTADQILELYALENVAGLKFTEYDLYTMLKLKARGATVFYGRDEMLAAGLLFGADGGIGSFYNVIPELFVRMYNLAQGGQWEETKPLQAQINEFITITLRFPLFPAIKTMLGWTGIECGNCLAPRRESLTDAEAAALSEALQQAELYELLFAGAAVN